MASEKKLLVQLEEKIHAWLSALEGPEGSLDRTLVRQAEAIGEAREEVDKLKAGLQTLETEMGAAIAGKKTWQERAQQAVLEGRDDLAREALLRARLRDAALRATEEEYGRRERDIAELAGMLAKLEQEHRAFERDREIIAAKMALGRLSRDLARARELMGSQPEEQALGRALPPEKTDSATDDEALESAFAELDEKMAHQRARAKLAKMKQRSES